ncbi:glycosyltransferase family 4 protein [Myroides fluvii]|uniref:glycosyltransferase family 4 protein n=1 Tax=Myroides fluvii TaxID=2572594 RepID=UPI00131B56CF|nr:glycosyltransferase family 4 protein [Myroides fluvii]
MNSIIVHAWTLFKVEDEYFIPYTHWVYLNEIVKYYDEVWLMSPVKVVKDLNKGFISLNDFTNLYINELPYSSGYIDTIKYFPFYYNAYKKLSKTCNRVYTRYPGPFGWLQMFFFEKENRIIHYVGDPVDTIVNNPNLSSLKKSLYRMFFKPEDFMFKLASKKATVYTNGHHIAKKLSKKGIVATPMISTTLNNEDFYFINKTLNLSSPKFIYVGYLRKAKGVDTVLKAFNLIQKKTNGATLTIVGTGESEKELKKLVQVEDIKNVVFTGHVDQRKELNELLRGHDVFVFGSLSEGSPRVILEAMANGLAVVSTPVGSLPSTFVDKEEILFAEFNSPKDFANKMNDMCNNKFYNELRENSFNKVKTYTIESFLKKIFKNA